MQYINLLSEKQNMILSKLNNLESDMSKLRKDNKHIKEYIELIDDKMNIIEGKEDDSIGVVNKVPTKDVAIKIDGNLADMDNFNPLELIFGQMLNKKKLAKEEVQQDSDDEYDNNVSIYESDNKDSSDENFVELNFKIENINDLISIGLKYKDQVEKSDKKTNNGTFYELDGKKYSINLETVCKLSKPLIKLSHMIGMSKVKNDMFEMIIFFLQNFEKANKNMLHSVIEGSPGVGKTKLGKIMAQIYCALGIIPSERFKYTKASDLIGDHVGATRAMTQKMIDEADGGVLFIDEAYALSSNDKDPYGKECLDTLNFNLSENKKKLIVIIAGYPDQLDKYFFAYNPGLDRRFPFRFRIEPYTPVELYEIFIDKLKRTDGWKLSKTLTKEKLCEFFTKNKNEFPHFGGDIENLFKKCQFAHSRRVIGKNPKFRGKLIFDDIQKGFENFKQHKREDKTKLPYPEIYT